MNLSRRGVLAATAASGAAMTATLASAATFGNPDQPPQGAVNVTDPRTLAISGPHDAALADTMPAFVSPPPTDVGSMPQFWASFNLAQRRIQDGGWGRQVTQSDFAISSEISGVNMRLSAGGIRELHWHQQAEWSMMTYGRCRITVLDAKGRPYVAKHEESQSSICLLDQATASPSNTQGGSRVPNGAHWDLCGGAQNVRPYRDMPSNAMPIHITCDCK